MHPRPTQSLFSPEVYSYNRLTGSRFLDRFDRIKPSDVAFIPEDYLEQDYIGDLVVSLRKSLTLTAIEEWADGILNGGETASFPDSDDFDLNAVCVKTKKEMMVFKAGLDPIRLTFPQDIGEYDYSVTTLAQPDDTGKIRIMVMNVTL